MEHPHLKRAVELCDLAQKAIKERYSWEVIDGLLGKLLQEMKEGLKQIEKSKPGRRAQPKARIRLTAEDAARLIGRKPETYPEGKE